MKHFHNFLKIFLTFVVIIAGIMFPGNSRAQEVPYGTGTWSPDTLGNHRAVVRVLEKSDAVWAHIPWRRKDKNPGDKRIVIIDGETGNRVANVHPVNVKREYADIIFQPSTVPADYYIYYLSYTIRGRNYPTVTYLKLDETAEESWLKGNGLTEEKMSQNELLKFPRAIFMEMQSINEFNSFYPMEIIATEKEVQALISENTELPYLLFPEDRKYPIRMTGDLPLKWVKEGPRKTFRGVAARGEFYTFQLGLYAHDTGIKDLDVNFTDLRNTGSSAVISSSALRCFNTGGINWDGKKFDKKCPVEKGKVQALWCGVQVPEDIQPGTYEGNVTVVPEGAAGQSIKLILNVTAEILPDAGDSEPWRHSRLRWLDSRLAMNHEVVQPFIPVEIENKTVSCLGRNLTFGTTGFPEQIKSFFSPEVTHITGEGREILSSPVQLIIEKEDKSQVEWKSSKTTVVRRGPGTLSWESKNTTGDFSMNCRAVMEFDGFVSFEVALTSLKETDIHDVRLEIPVKRDVARYFMGLGYKGGFRPPEIEWKWNVKNHQEGAWIGDVNRGFQFILRAENYSRPLNTNFYQSKPLNMPPSWYNGGKGGITIKEADSNTVLINAYSGQRTMKAGDTLHYNFNLLLTPFKPLDTELQWSTRFYHRFTPIDEIAELGANTINVHHANEANPYINYPFIHTKEMKEYVDKAHAREMKVKIYNTIRELSNRAPELFAFFSLNGEIMSEGDRGGYSWLQEHIDYPYIAAWFVPEWKDAAVINSGMSRWHNYYVEGLNWLVQNIGINGLYIDDIAFDRTTMKRVRKVLDRGRKGAFIDLHSANQYNPRDGHTNSANLYMEHFPYINRLWFGEYFNYDFPPDFWLVEVSGIPFGLMGEMLQSGGNKWRGMIYGITPRLPWAGDPTALWKFWDEFGIQDTEMVGYWAENCPVKTGRNDVLATVYVKEEKTLVSLASWAEENVGVKLEIDWESLKLDPQTAKLKAHAIKDFQNAAVFNPNDLIPVEKGKGWLLIIE